MQAMGKLCFMEGGGCVAPLADALVSRSMTFISLPPRSDAHADVRIIVVAPINVRQLG